MSYEWNHRLSTRLQELAKIFGVYNNQMCVDLIVISCSSFLLYRCANNDWLEETWGRDDVFGLKVAVHNKWKQCRNLERRTQVKTVGEAILMAQRLTFNHTCYTPCARRPIEEWAFLHQSITKYLTHRHVHGLFIEAFLNWSFTFLGVSSWHTKLTSHWFLVKKFCLWHQEFKYNYWMVGELKISGFFED